MREERNRMASVENARWVEFGLADVVTYWRHRRAPRIPSPRMRTPIVALVCDPDRSVVGTFHLTADGALMLDEFAFLPSAAADAAQLWRALAERARCGARVVAVPPAAGTLTKFAEVPRLRRAQRERVVRFEATQAIPRPLEETAWDWAPLAKGRTGVELVAMKLSAAEELCAQAERAGVQVETIVTRATALLRVMRHAAVAGDGVSSILLQVDGDMALLVRCDGDLPAVRLAGVPARVRVNAGGGTESAPETLRERRLAAEVKRLARGGVVSTEVGAAATVWLTGAAAPEPTAFEPFLMEAGLKLASFDPLRRVKLGKAAANAAAEAASLATLVGAALAAVEGSAPNLLPVARRRENAFRRNRWRWLVLAGAITGSVWGVAWFVQTGIAQQRAEVAALTRELEPWRGAQRLAAEQQREIDACERELTVLQSLVRAKESWPKFLADAQSRCARAGGAWLESVQFVAGADGAPGAGLFGHARSARAGDGVARQRLAISGCARETWLEGPRGLERVRQLLREWPEAEAVAAVEGERFDASAPGLLRFSCVLVLEPEAGL
ncbi:MAG TPA: hypothetical protein VK163_12155 [Opitutaceae bacterium]|nr:hypothetical protein [Opitutaceae bacterium]